MKTKMEMNAKNMVRAYYNSNVDAGLWEAYLTMMYAGFITEQEFNRFREVCKAWFWNFETSSVWTSTATGEEEVNFARIIKIV